MDCFCLNNQIGFLNSAGAGVSFPLLGSLLSNHQETPGETLLSFSHFFFLFLQSLPLCAKHSREYQGDFPGESTAKKTSKLGGKPLR